MSGRFNLLIAGCIAVALFAAPASAASAVAVIEHSSWTEIVRTLWPIVVVIGGLVAAGIVLGLSMRFPTMAAFRALKADVIALQDHRIKHAERIQSVEQSCAGTPSRQELQEDIAELRAICSGFGSDLAGIKSQNNTTNTYLHTLIERGLAR